jgi:hypothetical protein
MGSAFSQTFPPKPVFSVEQIPDLTGQVVIVTGYFLHVPTSTLD